MYCKNCGNIYEDPNASFCFRCGTPRGEGNSYCQGCGAPINPGQASCFNCGKATGYAGNNQNTYNNINYNNNFYDQPKAPQNVPIKYRNIALCIIFSIISCGIYGIYWFVTLTDDANALAGDYKTSGGMAILWTILTCGIYGIYWAYKQGEKLDYAKQSRGIPSANSGILYLLLSVFGLSIIAYCLMQNEINKFANME